MSTRKKNKMNLHLGTSISTFQRYGEQYGFTLDDIIAVLDYTDNLEDAADFEFPSVPEEPTVGDYELDILLPLLASRFQGIDIVAAYIVITQHWMLRRMVFYDISMTALFDAKVRKDDDKSRPKVGFVVNGLGDAYAGIGWQAMLTIPQVYDFSAEGRQSGDTRAYRLSAIPRFEVLASLVRAAGSLEAVAPFWERGIFDIAVIKKGVQYGIDGALLSDTAS